MRKITIALAAAVLASGTIAGGATAKQKPKPTQTKVSISSLTSTTPGLTGSLTLHARVAEGQLCMKLTIKARTKPAVRSLRVLRGATTVGTLDTSALSSAGSSKFRLKMSGCMAADQSLVQQVAASKLKLKIKLTTSGGVLTGTLR